MGDYSMSLSFLCSAFCNTTPRTLTQLRVHNKQNKITCSSKNKIVGSWIEYQQQGLFQSAQSGHITNRMRQVKSSGWTLGFWWWNLHFCWLTPKLSCLNHNEIIHDMPLISFSNATMVGYIPLSKEVSWRKLRVTDFHILTSPKIIVSKWHVP